MEGSAKSEVGGGGGGLPLEPFFRGLRVRVISYFTVNWCFKPTTIVFIDDRLFPVG